jgi:hypothetical protein
MLQPGKSRLKGLHAKFSSRVRLGIFATTVKKSSWKADDRCQLL